MDSDVAELYGVETREVNQAIKNNPNKFPQGYIIQLDKAEWSNLKSKILTSKGEDSLRSKNLILNKQGRWQHSKYLPNVFTEKGLYMLATILKGERATDTETCLELNFALFKVKHTVKRKSENY